MAEFSYFRRFRRNGVSVKYEMKAVNWRIKTGQKRHDKKPKIKKEEILSQKMLRASQIGRIGQPMQK